MPSTPSATRRSPRTVVRALPLRVWLVVIIVAVSSFGLLGSSAAVHYAMRGILMDRVDEELYASVTGWSQNPELYQLGLVTPPTEFSAMSISADGGLARFLYDEGTRPDFTELNIGAGPQTVQTWEGDRNDADWRALGVVNEEGTIIIVGKDLTSQTLVLRGLAVVQLTISLIAIAVMALVGAFFIRRALAPLREVEKTAQAISAGDTSRRVPYWPLDTEVGQLSHALNVMLARLAGSLNMAEHSLTVAQEKEAQMARFVGDASHELRTPLTSVRGYVELYRSGATDDVDRVMDKIDEESGRMKLLVEDLLALTRAEGSRLNKENVNLLEVAKTAASSARAAWPERTVEVIDDTTSDAIVVGDPARLHQILINLINNGFKHGGEEASVFLRLHRDPEDSGYEFIDVSDDGAGMDEETASHIFERFYRADSSRHRGTGGAGLGLSIVRSLVEQHGGTISVSTQEGEGTTFRIKLPEALQTETAPEEA